MFAASLGAMVAWLTSFNTTFLTSQETGGTGSTSYETSVWTLWESNYWTYWNTTLGSTWQTQGLTYETAPYMFYSYFNTSVPTDVSWSTSWNTSQLTTRITG